MGVLYRFQNVIYPVTVDIYESLVLQPQAGTSSPVTQNTAVVIGTMSTVEIWVRWNISRGKCCTVLWVAIGKVRL